MSRSQKMRPGNTLELNFIEQYWGAAKLRYRSSPKTNDIEEMERNIKACLDDVPDIQIRRFASFSCFSCELFNWISVLIRYANRSARFISAYSQGLSGAWANRKYHGHRSLPPDILADLKKEYHSNYAVSYDNSSSVHKARLHKKIFFFFRRQDFARLGTY